uniref:Uncharacterized protein n=1 Tax=Romanomermis culicivorax TaxID=13658 RepID=A0A915K8E4_ROMCU
MADAARTKKVVSIRYVICKDRKKTYLPANICTKPPKIMPKKRTDGTLTQPKLWNWNSVAVMANDARPMMAGFDHKHSVNHALDLHFRYRDYCIIWQTLVV